MGALTDLDDLLAGDYNTDYWADDLILHAHILVESLTDLDWQTLQHIWRSRPPVWQCQLAQVIAWKHEPDKAVPILVPMIEHGDDELSIAAADALRDLAGQVKASILTQTVRERLKGLAGRSRLSALVIDDLHRRLDHPAAT